MAFNPDDFPALTYQNVTDLSGALAGLRAVPEFVMSLEDFEAFLTAGQAIVEQGRAERALASELGYPMTLDSRLKYPGVGVQVVLGGPEGNQLFTVGVRRMVAKDAEHVLDSIFEDEDVEPLGEHYPQYGERAAEAYELVPEDDAQSLGAEVAAEVIELYTMVPDFLAADPITIDGVTKEREEWEAEGWTFTPVDDED